MMLHDCWRAWQLCTVAQIRCKISLKNQAIARKSHSLHSWIAYVIRRRQAPEQLAIASAHWKRKTSRRFFLKWVQTLQDWKLSEKEEEKFGLRAARHWSKIRLRLFFYGWIKWIKTFARPKKKKFAAVQAHINRMTMKQAVAAWRCIIHVKWVRRMKFEEAINQDNIWRRKRTLSRSLHEQMLPSLPTLWLPFYWLLSH